MNKLKNTLLIFAAIFGFSMFGSSLILQPVGAEQCGNTGTNIIGGEACQGIDNKSGNIEDNAIFVLLRRLINFLTGLIGIVAVVMIIVSGVMYTTAGDRDEQITKAKTMLKNTVIGIILYIFMGLILNFLIPGGLFGLNRGAGKTGNNSQLSDSPTQMTPGGMKEETK